MPCKTPLLLVTVDRAEFRKSHRQVAVAAHLGLVDLYVSRAVHRLDDKFLVIDAEHVHILPVVIVMSRGLPQNVPRHVRRRHKLISAAIQFVAQKILNHETHAGPFGMPENQARTGFFGNAE